MCYQYIFIVMFTKFIQIGTNIKDTESFNISDSNLDRMKKLFSKFDFVESMDRDGYSNMFCVIHENYIPQLFQFLSELAIEFTYKDLTKDVLFGFFPNVEDLHFESEDLASYNYLINEFLDANLDVDTVLDKILEHGKSSLTDKDISVLQKV